MERPTPTSRQELADAYDAIVAGSAAKPVSPSAETRMAAAQPATAPPAGKRQQLADAYDKLIDYEASKPRALALVEAGRTKRMLQIGVSAVCFMATAYLTIMQPAWLYPTVTAPVSIVSDEQAERSLAFSASVVSAFRARTGQLPPDMAALGVSIPGVSLLDLGEGRFRLSAVGAGAPITLDVLPNDSIVATATHP